MDQITYNKIQAILDECNFWDLNLISYMRELFPNYTWRIAKDGEITSKPILNWTIEYESIKGEDKVKTIIARSKHERRDKTTRK